MVYGPGTAIVYWLFKADVRLFSSVRLRHFYLRTSTTDFYSRWSSEVSRLYIEAFDKGELYDSAADDERLWRWPLNDYAIHASYIVLQLACGLYGRVSVYLTVISLTLSSIYVGVWFTCGAHHLSVYNSYYRSLRIALVRCCGNQAFHMWSVLYISNSMWWLFGVLHIVYWLCSSVYMYSLPTIV